MVLLTVEERKVRQEVKQRVVLRFLRTSIYSSSDILGEVLELKSPSSVSRSLAAIERRELIKRHTFHVLNGRMTLWGITAHGQAMAAEPQEDIVSHTFEPSKVGLATLQHTLDLQRLEVRADKAGWRGWQSCDRGPIRVLTLAKGNKRDGPSTGSRPDAIAITPDEVCVSIELERTIKTPRRYRDQIIPSHLQRINAGDCQYVVWVLNDADQLDRLQRILRTAAKELQAKGRFHLQPERVAGKIFRFTTMQDWPAYT